MAAMSGGNPGVWTVSNRVKTVCAALMFLGLAAFVVGLVTDRERAWHAYLVGFFYFASVAVGGLFFTAIQHLTSAGWSVTIRRFSESFASFLPVAILFAIGLVVGAPSLYVWLDKGVVAGDPLLQHKVIYLNWPFFAVRMVGFFILWALFARAIVGASTKQDETGDEKLTLGQSKKAIAFLLSFALSYSFFSVDALMSLEPHWFSTMFGIYCFAGLFQSTLAAMILLVIHLMKKGKLNGFVDENHLHDLGKFLFAFTVFWAYIAFSQFMLIWYANMPEETGFFMHRVHGSWAWVSMSLIVFKFIVPFLALLPRWAKRTPAHLAAVSVLILIMQFVDLYWLVYPNYNSDKAVLGVMEILVFLGFAGAFLFSVTRFLGRHSIVPYRDPRLHEATHHHVVY